MKAPFEASNFLLTFVFCRYVVTGDENGDLTVRELLSPTLTRAPVQLHLPISDLGVAPGDAHCVAALRDGSVVVVAVGNLSADKKNKIV